MRAPGWFHMLGGMSTDSPRASRRCSYHTNAPSSSSDTENSDGICGVRHPCRAVVESLRCLSVVCRVCQCEEDQGLKENEDPPIWS